MGSILDLLTAQSAYAAARSQAAALLGPLAPGRVGEEIRFTVSRTSGVGPDAARRLLANLDEERISGTLVLAQTAAARPAEETERRLLETQWDECVAALPADWSDLLCRVTLASSDDLPRAALLAAPLNPSRPSKEQGFDFRVARTTGYGASPQMVRADANNRWTDAPTAITYLESLNFKFFTLEEPLQAGDIDGMRQIAETLGTHIILDESLLRAEQLVRFAESSACWIVNLRVSKMGGLLPPIVGTGGSPSGE